MAGEDPDFFSADIKSARRFCLDLSPAPSERLTVVCGGCEHCTPEYVIERDGFAYYTIEFVARGAGSLRLAGKDYSLRPGTLFAYGPDEHHRIVTDPTSLLVKYFVSLAGNEARALLEAVSLRVFAQGYELERVEVSGDKLIVERRGRKLMVNNRFPRLERAGSGDGHGVIGEIKSVLQRLLG